MTTTTRPAVPVETMKAKLYTLDQARTALERTEPLATYGFTVGEDISFDVRPGWHHGIDTKDGTEPVDAVITIGRGPGAHQFPLTKDALLEASSICGLTKTYAVRCPAELLTPQLNFWFRDGLRSRTGTNDYQLLVAAETGAAITRASIQPFSNLRLMQIALDGIAQRYGNGEILVDYKFAHSLRKTHLRLIIPEYMRAITATGTDEDTWSIGLQIKNSLIGEERTSIDGYLFRWWCTNGATDTRNSSGAWTRRGGTGERDSEVYEWAQAAVDDVLGGLEPALDAVQAMVDMPIAGNASEVLRDVFEHYRVPLPDRARIIEGMVEDTNLNMYTVMAAVTQAANHAGIPASHVDTLLQMGGDLPYAATSRCDACRRLLHH